MGGFHKAREIVGSSFVRFGLRLLGYKRRDSSDFSVEAWDAEEETGDAGPATLSEEAKRMIADGSPEWTPPKVDKEVPLKGSVADRLRTARREMGK